MSETSEVPNRVKSQSEKANELMGSMHVDPGEQELADEESTQPQEADAGTGDEKDQPPQQEHDWEQRFRQYKAATDRTIHEHRVEISTLKQQLKQAQEASQSNEGSAEGEGAPVTTNAAIERLRTDFGDELADGVLAIVQSANQPVQQEIDRFKHSREIDADTRFWDVLKSVVPNWKQINDDAGFHQWLAQVDPPSGRPRQILLNEAQQAKDGGRVSAIFQEYLDAQQTAQGNAERLNNRVMPDNVPAGNEPQSHNERTWTRAEISAFYKDKQMGRFVNREDDAAALENDLMRAQIEGRIVG